jgi:hypothetical protein
VQANSKVQIVLKKIRAEVKCIKKILQRHEIEKEIRAAKILYPPPPGISNGPPLSKIFSLHRKQSLDLIASNACENIIKMQ